MSLWKDVQYLHIIMMEMESIEHKSKLHEEIFKCTTSLHSHFFDKITDILEKMVSQIEKLERKEKGGCDCACCNQKSTCKTI